MSAGAGSVGGGALPPRLEALIEATLEAADLPAGDRAEVRAELEAHFRDGLARGRTVAELVEAFGDPGAAADPLRRSRRRLGRSRERAAAGPGWWTRLPLDGRVAARRLSGDRGFSLSAGATIGVAVGAVTLVFTLVWGILLAPLPYPDAERLVAVEHTAPGWGFPELSTISPGLYVTYRESEVLSALGMYRVNQANTVFGDRAARVDVVRVTPGLLDLLGARTALGRTFLEAEGRPGSEHRVLLTHRAWRQRLAGDPAVVGSQLDVDGEPHRVVGVLDRSFSFPGADPVLLLPEAVDPATASTGNLSYRAIGRLTAGTSPERAEAALTTLIPAAVEERPGLHPRFVEEGPLAVRIQGLKEREVADVRRTLWVLLGAVGLLFLLATANVGNLYLLRTEARGRDLAVRAAMGARRSDLRATVVLESALLALPAAAVGVGVAAAALAALRPQLTGLPRVTDIGLGPVPILTAVSVALLLALTAGWLPRIGVRTVATVLRSGNRFVGGWLGGQRALVVVQVALAIVLVVGSGLLVRTAGALADVEPGFETERLLVFDLVLPETEEAGRAYRFHREMARSLASVPGVEAVGFGRGVPMRDAYSGRAVIVPAWIGRDSPGGIFDTRWVHPGYFGAAGISIERGRALEGPETGGAPEVVVSHALADRIWPGEDPIGKQLRPDDPSVPLHTVVGVAGDTRDDGLTEPPAEILYVAAPLESDPWGFTAHAATYVVRTGVAPGSLFGTMESVVAERAPSIPVSGLATAQDILRNQRARVSLLLLLLGTAAAASLLLAAIGVFGVAAAVAQRRTREIGIRLALGAQRGQVRRMVIGQNAWLFLGGAAAGLLLTVALGQFVRALLFGVAPTDPVTLLAGTTVVLTAAFGAAAIPAWRAAQVDPVDSIRNE